MANKILKNKEVVKKKKKKGKSTVSKKKHVQPSLIHFFKNRKVHLIFGIFLFLFSIFLFCSFISFFSTFEADDSIYKSNFFETLSTNDIPKNKLGILGLYFSFFFIKDSFGIASLGFIFLFNKFKKFNL